METEDAVTSAADIIWEHWRDGRRMAALPEPVRPRTRADGYAVQAALAGRSPRPLFGWKIAATSVAGQRHINVDGPLAGRLFRERVFEPGAEVPLGANSMRVAEAEFAFRMAVDLPSRAEAYTVDEVLDAVATLHPAIEIPDSRYDDFTLVGAPQLIADNACAHHFVLGPATSADWRRMDLVEHPVIATISDRETRTGKGGHVLGDPRIALAWLVNELSGIGVALRAGEVVTTGTCIVPPPIAPGDRVRVDFGALGGVEIQMGT
ncbi:MAG: fumarylacetoacetate hydrolase family protein [Vicinamibacteraceae bacterium]